MSFCENSSCSLRGFVASIERPSCHSVERRCASWSTEQDSNLRFYCFADSCLGPLGHRCIILATGRGLVLSFKSQRAGTATLPVCLAYPEGFEPSLAVLETVVLPLTLRIHDWCPWEDSNLHTPAYLAGALARYKLASLPIKLQGHVWWRADGIEPLALSDPGYSRA
jgi:hypothetical protein